MSCPSIIYIYIIADMRSSCSPTLPPECRGRLRCLCGRLRSTGLLQLSRVLRLRQVIDSGSRGSHRRGPGAFDCTAFGIPNEIDRRRSRGFRPDRGCTGFFSEETLHSFGEGRREGLPTDISEDHRGRVANRLPGDHCAEYAGVADIVLACGLGGSGCTFGIPF